MARKRMGKRQRIEAKRNAFQAERASIIAANLAAPKVSKPVACGPKGFRSSTASVTALKGRSHDIGFVGPRGYHTPRDTLSKAEQRPGLLAPRHRPVGERREAVAMAQTVKGF